MSGLSIRTEERGPGVQNVREEIERIVTDRLRHWPAWWEGYHWPGYTYEHTFRVTALATELARREGADEQVVELAGLLHDLRKDSGSEHAALGAEEAIKILMAHSVPNRICFLVCDAIAKHDGGNTPVSPVENRVLGDADLIDANFGLVAVWRYVTIRAGSGLSLKETLAGFDAWLARKDALLHDLLTPSGREVARQRAARMHVFCEHLQQEARASFKTDEFRALDMVAYMHADRGQHLLCEQLSELEKIAEQCNTDPVVALACRALRREIEGTQ